MRAALVTTAVVIAALAVWASLREPAALRDVTALEGAPAQEAPLPDVAAGRTSEALPPDQAAGGLVVRSPADSEETAPPPYTTAAESGERPLREHVVAEGETLAEIAERYYGDAERADAIYQANRDQIRDPAQLHAGQTLVLP